MIVAVKEVVLEEEQVAVIVIYIYIIYIYIYIVSWDYFAWQCLLTPTSGGSKRHHYTIDTDQVANTCY